MQSSELQQDLYSLGEFARRHSIGLRTVYAEISAGRLTARKIGRRTVIALDDAKTWIAQLPKVQPRTAAAELAETCSLGREVIHGH
jgi:excisionase family DNA binding protein